MRKTVAFGRYGARLWRRGSQRWEKWRPGSVPAGDAGRSPPELLYDARSPFEGLKKDIASVLSPETEVVGEIAIRKPVGLRRGFTPACTISPPAAICLPLSSFRR